MLMLSAIALGEASAGEAIVSGQRLAQASSPSGSCMPIGVTAAGELVFPWDCREIIERERGPVSVDLSMPPKISVSNQRAPSEPAPAKAAVVNDGAKSQPPLQSAAPEHVATIPEAAARPTAASPVIEPADRRFQAKRLVAAGRRPPDAKGGHAPVQPVQPGAPQPKRDIRFAPPG